MCLGNMSRNCYLERMVVSARSGLPEPCLCSTGNCWVRSPEILKISVVEIRNTGILKLDTLKNRCAEFYQIFHIQKWKYRCCWLFFFFKYIVSFTCPVKSYFLEKM